MYHGILIGESVEIGVSLANSFCNLKASSSQETNMKSLDSGLWLVNETPQSNAILHTIEWTPLSLFKVWLKKWFLVGNEFTIDLHISTKHNTVYNK